MKVKTIFRNTCLGLFALGMFSSCGDMLDTNPTQSMSGSGLLANGNAAQVPLNGIYRTMYTSGWTTTDNTHQCFGIPAYTIMADVMGEDMIMQAMGSGWFWFDALYNVKSRYTSSAWRSYDLWNAYYTWISNANYIISAEETMGGAELEKNYAIGQAYAIRAYSYFMLAQNFARTYKGHEDESCVPIYDGPTTPSTTGQPRSTVAKVYEQIDNDINKAITLLEGTTQKDPSHIGYAVALGIKARIALVEEKWTEAKNAAHDAITASGKSILPVSSFAGLNNASAGNVMWGFTIIADQSGKYAGLFTHMDADCGYYAASARKEINKELYAKMSATDTRRAWWNPNDANNKDKDGNEYGYQQEKFKFADIQTWMGDYVIMRVEEMYLIAAEAECRLGEETAARTDLMALMSKRDPNYSTSKTGTALGVLSSDVTGSLLEEIINQRRIELWGEAGRMHDLKRLKQGFRRTRAQGWPSDLLLSTRPTDDPEAYMNVFTIPQKEFDGNENMNPDTDQNPVGDYK